MRKVRSYPVVVELEDGSKVEGRCYSALAHYCPVGRLPYLDAIMPKIREMANQPEAASNILGLQSLIMDAIAVLLAGVEIDMLKENWTGDDIFDLWAQLTTDTGPAGVADAASPFTPTPASS